MNILNAKFCNPDSSAVVIQTAERGAVAIQLTGDDNSGGLRADYLAWGQQNPTTPFVAPAVDAIEMAEAHTLKYFSNAKLTQMKVWMDLIPHANTPKLMAVFEWTAQVTGSAALQGATVFSLPPHTFAEVAEECIPQLMG